MSGAFPKAAKSGLVTHLLHGPQLRYVGLHLLTSSLPVPSLLCSNCWPPPSSRHCPPRAFASPALSPSMCPLTGPQLQVPAHMSSSEEVLPLPSLPHSLHPLAVFDSSPPDRALYCFASRLTACFSHWHLSLTKAQTDSCSLLYPECSEQSWCTVDSAKITDNVNQQTNVPSVM